MVGRKNNWLWLLCPLNVDGLLSYLFPAASLPPFSPPVLPGRRQYQLTHWAMWIEWRNGWAVQSGVPNSWRRCIKRRWTLRLRESLLGWVNEAESIPKLPRILTNRKYPRTLLGCGGRGRIRQRIRSSAIAQLLLIPLPI